MLLNLRNFIVKLLIGGDSMYMAVIYASLIIKKEQSKFTFAQVPKSTQPLVEEQLRTLGYDTNGDILESL